MISFIKNMTIPTYLKYLISYLILYTTLILGFFFIMKTQITKNYFTARSEQAGSQLNSLAIHLVDDIVFLTQLDSDLASNQTINKICYREDKTYYYPALKELKRYISTSNLLSSIIYMPKNTQDILSTNLYVTYHDDIFYITDSFGQTISFDPKPYYDAYSGQLVFIRNEMTEYLLYFPVNNSGASFVYFYILDTYTLQSQIKGLVSAEMPAIALVDSKGQIITGINSFMLPPYMDHLSLANGIYKQDSSTSICVSKNISNGFSIVSILSNDLLTEQINATFSGTYLSLLLLSAGTFFLILLIMKFIFEPLHKLVKSVIPNYDLKQNYVNQLSQAFAEAEEHNLQMQEKLNNYRISIQKSLFDSILSPQYASTSALPNIDQLFDNTLLNREIFIIRISGFSEPCCYDNVIQYFNNSLSINDSCLLLESIEDYAVFLINFTGDATDKSHVLKELCNRLYEEKGYFSAISNSSGSPLDIPSLYETAARVSSYWSQNPITDYHSLSAVQTTYIYPHDELNLFSDSLKTNNFFAARAFIDSMLTKLTSYSSLENTLPSFFVNCILIDILTIIVNNMNLAYIDFHSYSDIYFNLLYLCRSFPYTEKEKEISQSIEELLDLYEKTISDKLLNTAPIKQLMEQNYCNPNFSISVIADKYHVSVSRMSVLFKQELNIGFADYLWLLRFNKAKELLSTTDLSIDEISIAIGYTTSSSFRRKFKQEIGISPSQYRIKQRGA